MCENLVNDFEPSDTELNTLNSLRRGVYALRDIEIGEKITTLNTFFAIPTHSDQLLTNDLSKFAEWISKTVIKKNEPIYRMNLKKFSERELVEEFALEAKNTLALAGIVLPDKVDFEISHHYGVNQFDTIGLVLLTIINRDYCKKYLVLKAGQSNPEHFHELKEETFYCVQGQVELTVENIKKFLKPGDLVVIPRGKKHSFTSNTGAIIEEISSTSIVDDSYYTDPKINSNNNRKSKISLWK
jgi:quercetin dioxygenase-like cupin family protein